VGSPIDEVAARVSFTVETTVLLSFAVREIREGHRPRMAQDSAAKQRPCWRCNGGLAAQMGQRRRADPTL
jgi:hypothetical protein